MVKSVTTTQIDFDLSEYVEILKNQNYKGNLVSILHTENNSFSDAVVPEKENAKLNNLNNCEFLAGDVAEIIKNVKDKPDTIILDTPRSDS